MKKTILRICIVLIGFSFLLSCGTESKKSNQTSTSSEPIERKTIKIPRFNRDSAYTYIADQVEMGARVPGTEAHIQARDYILAQLKSFGFKTEVQEFTAENYLGESMQGYNIIGIYNEDAERRILLTTHWDSRFMSDHDPVEANKNKPVPAANDGASGVGILLEIARILEANPVDIGIDLVFFDLEDQGEDHGQDPMSWCLGSQHWSRNPHRLGSEYMYGILLDMVGAENAQFKYEAFSRKYAPSVLDKVWSLASAMGYGNYFRKQNVGAITDDHYFVNTIAGIPTIDIIDRRQSTESGFFQYWHTSNDTMEHIDKSTLRAVGQVLVALIYKESIGALN